MKLFEKEHTYSHPWSRVTLAFWRKYPNQLASHIKNVDMLKRSYDQKNSTYTTHRIITAESSLPSWFTALGMETKAHCLEKTVVNAKDKTMVVKTRNFTADSIVVVEETCTYKQDPNNPSNTLYKQEARITSFLPIVTGKIESFTHSNLSMKSTEGIKYMETLCQNIKHGYNDLLRPEKFYF